MAIDGSTLHYDVYDPSKKKKESERDSEERDSEEGDTIPCTFFVCPGESQ